MYHFLDPDTVLRQRAADIDRVLAARRQRPRNPQQRNTARSAARRVFDQLRLG
jgi:hypothetical protein